MSVTNKQALIKLIESLPDDSLNAANALLQKLIPPPPFMKVDFSSAFERDFRKEGFELAVREDGTVEDVDLLSGEVEFDAPVSFLRGKETSVGGEEMCQRTLEIGANYSHRDGEKLKNWFNNTPEGKEVRKSLQGLYVPLTGTVWVGRGSRRRCVASLNFGSEDCCLHLHDLGSGYSTRGRLLPLRKR